MLDAGMLPESEKVGKIIWLFCKGRREKEAHIVYLTAKEKNKCPPQRAVNLLISWSFKGGGNSRLGPRDAG